MIVIGLTGSIAMGKSHAFRAFWSFGAPGFDADRAVHDLMAPGGGAVAAIEARFPGCLDDHGAVDRKKLGARVFGAPDELRALERLLHPRVRMAERRFLGLMRRQGRRAAVLDIPLLFETRGERRVDFSVVVSAPKTLQRRRAMARPGMTEERLRTIRGKQLADAKKRARADFVIRSANDWGETRRQIGAALEAAFAAHGSRATRRKASRC